MGSAADRGNSPSRVSVWLDRRTPSRTRKAEQPTGLDRDRITAASVRLLDADGLAKFSMRRLAAELDVTAMSLYWYVDTKDDLLELALDTVFGEIPATAEDLDWRDRLRELATSYRKMFVRHPWVSALVGSFLNIGPHSMLFSYAVQDVVRATGLPLERQTGAMAAVFQFVYGFGTTEGTSCSARWRPGSPRTSTSSGRWERSARTRRSTRPCGPRRASWKRAAGRRWRRCASGTSRSRWTS